MIAVAGRIQEQAQRLAQEKQRHVDVQSELNRFQAMEQSELQKNRGLRMAALRATILRDTSELELMEKQDSLKDFHAKTRLLEGESKDLLDQVDRIQDEYQKNSRLLYAPYKLEMELHRKQAETELNSRILRSNQRSDKIRELRIKLKHLKEARSQIVLDRHLLTAECKAFKKEELDSISQISTLSEKVQHALAKVCYFCCWDCQLAT